MHLNTTSISCVSKTYFINVAKIGLKVAKTSKYE